MKKCLLGLALLFAGSAAMAQFDASQLSIGLAGNYTMYKGNLQKSTPGAQIRVGYDISDKTDAYLAFNYGFAIKSPSSITYSNGVTTTSGESTINFKFKTITLNANYSLIGNNEEGFAFLGGFGASYVMVSYDETPKATPPAGFTAQDQIAKSNESGFVINLNLGAKYRTGNLAPFFDAGISLPANQANGVYYENAIPTHIVLNAGVKFYLGSSGN